MRKRLVPLVAALALATLLAPGLVTPAAADGGWIGGAAFRIGGVFLSIGFNTVGSHRAGYYYRTRYRFHDRDYHCGAACYVDGGVYYHSESCPVVLHYLRRYDVEPYGLFVRFGPRYPAPYYGERLGVEIYRNAPPPPRYDHRHDARRHGYRSYGEYRRYGRYDRDPRGRYYDPRRDHRWRDDRDHRWRDDRDRRRRDDRDRDRRHDHRDHRDRSRRHGG